MSTKEHNTQQAKETVKSAARSATPESVGLTMEVDATRLQRAIADLYRAKPVEIQALQRTVGNRAVTHLIQTNPVLRRTAEEEQVPTKPLVQRNGEAAQSWIPNHSLTALPPEERTRKLAEELEYKATAGDRARTWEETKIDVAGTGSALKSLVTSPWQTLKNAAKGMFSGFPSRATLKKQAVVQNAIGAAWAAAQGDYSERFGWVTWDKNADTYAVPAVSVGDPYRCTPPAKPVDPAPNDVNQVFHVGEFHIHPPLDPGEPAMANPRDWPIGPSEQDETAAQADHSPGIVRDFDKIDRNGGVTDYTYGPWTRTE